MTLRDMGAAGHLTRQRQIIIVWPKFDTVLPQRGQGNGAQPLSQL